MKENGFMRIIGTLLVAGALTACGKEDPQQKTQYTWGLDGGVTACDHLTFTLDGKEDSEGTQIGNGDDQFVFTGKQTLKKGTYVLKGWVYIAEGAELTIEPGTVIKGDKLTKAALITERGGKLIAQGSKDQPIVFTSAQPKGQRRPGDWGGVILCGKAPNNSVEMQIEGGPRSKHGGEIAGDDSGVLSYVRIEFAGYPFEKDKEINGLTLGSVGSGTKLDHIQVSYSNDDSFEWFGGNADCKYLVAYHGWDDDFDTDNGYSGNVQFALAIRDSRIADYSQSNGFESDNNAGGTDTKPYTSATFSNVTFIGPKTDASFVNEANTYINAGDFFPDNGSALGRFQSAMHIRRHSHLRCINSVAADFPIGIMIDSEKGRASELAASGEIVVNNVWIAGVDILGSDMNKKYRDNLVVNYKGANDDEIFDATKPSFSHTWFLAQDGNRQIENTADLGLKDYGNTGSSYMATSGSPLMNAAKFTDSQKGFEKVSYIGAVSESDNWLESWTEFHPESKEY